ncbi:hypothetical protein Q4Y15_000207 [Campylobacter fetus]|uniref:Tetratricopeptide repeat protein n=3 Tax=Campylobacter fetus TaxID=196 RepID=A0A5L8V882_CAMFE|nr:MULTISPECIES: hypothetical protein [Campylobacter]OCS23206.1 hypothetical protein CFVI97532_00030 [Campylobacter fetus subsp. venerealis cfvi97/532]OCS26741.1 hypothetical protein CFVB10_02575 [Campylobacter fetus subsp. venerealis cfvB10]OCS30573.1 hypothetical protein CFVCCUG33900_00330 [Campylobacter fetus subsp. venerealis LMG 6570 = CCUG 33900]OCS39189.1 hypothetical protein CFVI02298_09670 [Campylobacter fetus subsp. venerealis cfvi02/298]ABK81876.1 conserved hypothetical protein [Cam
MKNTITEALIYENQGLRNDALEVYKNILKAEPHNQEAQSAVRRLSGLRRKNVYVNEQMLDFFLNLKTDDEIGIREFKRWLVKI